MKCWYLTIPLTISVAQEGARLTRLVMVISLMGRFSATGLSAVIARLTVYSVLRTDMQVVEQRRGHLRQEFSSPRALSAGRHERSDLPAGFAPAAFSVADAIELRILGGQVRHFDRQYRH